MAPATAERIQLAKLCSSKDWSKAIRILDSLLAQSCAIQDFCNRAFCYSQLELHKNVVKDCNKALQLDPKLLQAYILKGHAFSAMGRKEEALLVWEQGYECAVCQSADLKQLMELEELMRIAKENGSIQNSDMGSSGSSFSASESVVSTKLSDASNNHGKSNGRIMTPNSSTQQVEFHKNGSSPNIKGESSFGSLSSTKLENRPMKPTARTRNQL